MDGVVPQRGGQNSTPIGGQFCAPVDRRIAEAYSKGRLIVDALPEYRELFQNLIEEIKKREPVGHAEAGA